MSIEKLLADTRFDFVSDSDKEFICAFVSRMSEIKYTFSDNITDGICWVNIC